MSYKGLLVLRKHSIFQHWQILLHYLPTYLRNSQKCTSVLLKYSDELLTGHSSNHREMPFLGLQVISFLPLQNISSEFLTSSCHDLLTILKRLTSLAPTVIFFQALMISPTSLFLSLEVYSLFSAPSPMKWSNFCKDESLIHASSSNNSPVLVPFF